MTKPIKTISTQIVWSCPWYRVRQDKIINPDGKPGVYNVIESPTSVWIIPITKAGEIVLIHNYRYTVDKYCWEVPAGSVEPGTTILETAVSELRQEVGGVAEKIEQIGRFYTANGICNEEGIHFLATGVTLGTPDHESTEVMEIHIKSIDEALAMARNGTITDANTALALLSCEPRLRALQSLMLIVRLNFS